MTSYAIQQQNQQMYNLLASQFRLLYNPTHAFADAVSMLYSFPGLRGLWTLGQYNSAGNVIDISGNGLTLTNTGFLLDSLTADLAPKSFVGVATSNLSRADEAALDILGNEAYVRSGQNLRGLTLGMWVRMNAVVNAQWAMSKWLTTGNQRSYGLLSNVAAIVPQFVISGNGTNVFSVNSTVTNTVRWAFICGRYRSEVPDISIFVDGTWDTNSTSIPSTIFNSTAAFRIGDPITGTGNGFIGRGSLAFLCHAAVPDIFINTFYQMTAPLFKTNI